MSDSIDDIKVRFTLFESVYRAAGGKGATVMLSFPADGATVALSLDESGLNILRQCRVDVSSVRNIEAMARFMAETQPQESDDGN